jgi:chromate transporter
MSWGLATALLGHCVLLSLLSIGGAITVAPEMHRILVEQHHLLSDAQFTSAIALAQAAPGPNVLFVAVLGFFLAGVGGAVAALIAIMLPSTTLALGLVRWAQAREDRLGVRAFRASMPALTLGLVAATAWLLAPGHDQPRLLALAVISALLVWRTRVHLLWLVGAAALLGAMGWV